MVQEISKIFNTTPSAICSANRRRENVLARNIVTDIAYNDFLFKYHEIGAVIKRNHSTLIKNKTSYEQDMIAMPELKYIRRQVLHNAQDYLLHLYGGHIFD
jgi:chromosomal replication initiation ATPase DnaA